MSVDLDALVEDLRRATRLVKQAEAGEIPFRAFLERYNGFFHDAALDGHEPDEALAAFIRSHRDLVKAHEEIQRNVVDAAYLGPSDDAEALEPAGRISIEEAERRLRQIASSCPLESLIARLGPDHPNDAHSDR